MEMHFELNDFEFEAQFENCTLNPELFSHEAHLRLAWIHIKKSGLLVALAKVSNQLINFVEYVGVKDKYNHTVTIAAIKAVSHFINKSKSSNFKDFIEEFPRLKYNFKELMSFHYSIDIFAMEKGKENYLEPDLLPFD